MVASGRAYAGVMMPWSASEKEHSIFSTAAVADRDDCCRSVDAFASVYGIASATVPRHVVQQRMAGGTTPALLDLLVRLDTWLMDAADEIVRNAMLQDIRRVA